METYLHYLEQVLGLRSVIWPVSEPVSMEADAQLSHPVLKVLFIAEKPWSPAARDLFQKMRDAMKISEEESQVLFASEAHLPALQMAALAAQRVVFFSPRLMGQISVETEAKFLTHNPEDLIIKPALKKEAWEELKKVMKSLGIL